MDEKAKADAALWAIHPQDIHGDVFFEVMTGYKAAGGDYETFDSWCAQEQDPARYKKDRERQRWDSISREGGIKPGTIFELAKQYGGYVQEKHSSYTPTTPKKKESQVKEEKVFVAMDRIQKTIQQSKIKPDQGVDYLKSRGISEETCKRFEVGYLDGHGVIIPFPGIDTPYYVQRNITIEPNGEGDRYKNAPGKKPVFNVPALNSTDGGIFITEGQIDCLSLESMGFPCIGCKEGSLLKEAIKKYGTTAAYFKIIPDNDKAGEEAKESLYKALNEAGKEVYICSLPDDIHDANAFLMKDPEGFWEWCRGTDGFIEKQKKQEREEYFLENNAAFSVENMMRDLNYPSPIPSGFSELDSERVLDGGFYPGLYLLAAITSLGKTTFAMQIADQTAALGNDVLIFSLEMNKEELISKSISRLTTEVASKEDHQSVRRVLRRDQWKTLPESASNAIYTAAAKYKKFANHIFIQDGMGDITAAAIRERITRHIKLTDRKPLVIVDYLQIMAPHNDKANERQVLEYNILELKRISRDLSVPVLVVTALNRADSASGATNNALKGSSSLEYTADVILFLQVIGAGEFSNQKGDKNRASENDKAQKALAAQPIRKLEIELLKNRHGSRKTKVQFTFDAVKNKFTQDGAVEIQYGPDPQENEGTTGTKRMKPEGF